MPNIWKTQPQQPPNIWSAKYRSRDRPGGGVEEWDGRWDNSASEALDAQLLASSNLYLARKAPQRNAEDLPLPASVPACTVTGGTPGPLARVNGPTPHSQLHVGPGACR